MSEQHDVGDGLDGVAPAVSILIVARNTGAYIGDAILSARQQTYRDLEVVVVDDASTDDTRAIAERHAAEDARVRVLDGPGAGLAAIRNASLDAARGRRVAILDSDDLLHPRHIEYLVAAAEGTGAEIVAANMVSFSIEAGTTRTALFADAPGWQSERWLDVVEYVRANSAAGDTVSAGYLKPLFDLAFLRRHDLRYDLRLRIAEDYDLVVRALAARARYRYLPSPTYFYRRHAGSTSHRQSVRDLTGMLLAADAAVTADSDPALVAAVACRTAGIRSALRHARAMDALKAGNPVRAAAAMGIDCAAWRMMGLSAVEGVSRRLRGCASRGQAEDRPGNGTPVVLAIGAAAPDSPLEEAASRLEREGQRVLRREAPLDDRARALLVDGMPPLARIIVAPPATLDDAAYAMAPGIARTV